MKSHILSVVIPTHNRPLSLQRAVASVHAQTDPPHEIIVVDDGSRPAVDSSTFSDSGVPVRVVQHQEAKGVAAARNAGVADATGQFVAFLDDDDTWLPEKLAFVKDCLSRFPAADVVIHQSGYRASAEMLNCCCAIVEDPLTRMLLKQPPSLDGIVIRRTLHLASPFDESFVGAEDLDYLIRLAKSGRQLVETNAVLAIVGDTETSAIGLEHRIRGRLELLNRHPEILADRTATAFFYVRLGHLQRRSGARLSASRSFLTAGSRTPLSLLVWKGLLLCLSPFAFRGVRQKRH